MQAPDNGRTPLTRLDRVWVGLPFALTVLCVALTLVSRDPVPDAVELTATVSGALVWHWWWMLRHPHWWERRLLPMAVYFIGLLLLTDHATGLAFTFFPLYLVCYPMAFVALPGRWAYAGVLLTAGVSLPGVWPSDWTVDDLVLGVTIAALVSVAGGAIRALEAESARRRAALAELATANTALERALADNQALQERLLEEARESGITAERARLAGEIHDTLAAGLAGVVSQLEALDAHLGIDHPLAPRVHTSVRVARESLREARRSVRALRPGPLDAAPLPGALEDLAARRPAGHDVLVEVMITGRVEPLPAAVEDVLLRSAHEALSNVGRHAGADAARVTLSYLGDAVALDVVDDGRGFDPLPGSGTSGGHGLAIMRDRVEAMDGSVEVDSEPGGPTTLTVTVPTAGGADG